MEKLDLVNQIKKFLDLDKRKTSLSVSELRDYLNIKKTIHGMGFNFEELKNLDASNVEQFVESKLQKEKVKQQVVQTLNKEEIEKVQELEKKVEQEVKEQETLRKVNIPIKPITTTEETSTVTSDEMIVESVESNEISTIKENEVTEEPETVVNEVTETAEEVKAESTNKEQTKEELMKLLEENEEEIIEAVRRLRKKSSERIVEITTGNKFKIVELGNKLLITIPINAVIKIQHALLLKLYNEQLGLTEEEVQEIESKTEQPTELEIKEEVKEPEEVKEQTVEETKPEVKEETKKEKKEPKVKKEGKMKFSVSVPRTSLLINDFKFSKNPPEEAIKLVEENKEKYSNLEIEEAVAKILDVPIENGKLCKGCLDIEKVTPKHLYLLRVFAKLKYNGIKKMLSRLATISEDEANQYMIKILKDEPEEMLTEFFSKQSATKIKGS